MGFLANFIQFPAVQKFVKSVKIWQSYKECKGGNVFWDSVHFSQDGSKLFRMMQFILAHPAKSNNKSVNFDLQHIVTMTACSASSNRQRVGTSQSRTITTNLLNSQLCNQFP